MKKNNPFTASNSTAASLAVALSLSFLGPAHAGGSRQPDPPQGNNTLINEKGADLTHLLPLLVTSSDQKRFAAELLERLQKGDLDGAKSSLDTAVDTATFAITLIDHLKDPNLVSALQGLGIDDTLNAQAPASAPAEAKTPAVCSTIAAPGPDNLAMLQEALDQERSYSGMVSGTLTDLTGQYNALTSRLEAEASAGNVKVSEVQKALQQERQKREATAQEFSQLQDEYRTLLATREQKQAPDPSTISDLQTALQRERERGDNAERELASARMEVGGLRKLKDRQSASEARVASLEHALSEAQSRGDELARMLADATQTVHVLQEAQKQSQEAQAKEKSPLDARAPTAPMQGDATIQPVHAQSSPGPAPSAEMGGQDSGIVTSALPVQDSAPVRDSQQPGMAATSGEKVNASPQQASGDDRLTVRAEELFQKGDISGARLLLERSLEGGNARAAFVLAETFDPHVLSKMGARGIRGDADKAREFYAKAHALGIAQASDRMEALK